VASQRPVCKSCLARLRLSRACGRAATGVLGSPGSTVCGRRGSASAWQTHPWLVRRVVHSTELAYLQSQTSFTVFISCKQLDLTSNASSFQSASTSTPTQQVPGSRCQAAGCYCGRGEPACDGGPRSRRRAAASRCASSAGGTSPYAAHRLHSKAAGVKERAARGRIGVTHMCKVCKRMHVRCKPP